MPAKITRSERSRRVERFHRTLLDEHFRVEGRRTWFETVEEMQVALDAYLVTYNTERPHQPIQLHNHRAVRHLSAVCRLSTVWRLF
jgi:transposase InsO family protein